ncbi:hypothetical protein [Halosegnis longus]|uniref:hypothetical protein n=1 Tax=Halosegnis longus TaxID=2216012 RepID=UPI00129D73F5|nr:hypothetical protein [Halosegnis longus]
MSGLLPVATLRSTVTRHTDKAVDWDVASIGEVSISPLTVQSGMIARADVSVELRYVDRVETVEFELDERPL